MAGTIGIYPGGPTPAGSRHPTVEPRAQRLFRTSTRKPIMDTRAVNQTERRRGRRRLLGALFALLTAATAGLWLGSADLPRLLPGPAVGGLQTTPDPLPTSTRP